MNHCIWANRRTGGVDETREWKLKLKRKKRSTNASESLPCLSVQKSRVQLWCYFHQHHFPHCYPRTTVTLPFTLWWEFIPPCKQLMAKSARRLQRPDSVSATNDHLSFATTAPKLDKSSYQETSQSIRYPLYSAYGCCLIWTHTVHSNPVWFTRPESEACEQSDNPSFANRFILLWLLDVKRARVEVG